MTKRKAEILDLRTERILDALVREYTKTAHPVGSLELLRRARLDVSPATIRNELLELCERGFLEQPHTSAGRVPTDKGYRFFVDHLSEEDNNELNSSEAALLSHIFEIRHEDEFMHEFVQVLSEISGAFAAVALRNKDFMYETGFSEVAEEPEFEDPARAREFGELVDRLSGGGREFFDTFARDEERIFIGEENPLGFPSYSMVVSQWRHPRGFEGFFTLVGPKRTDYAKHKAVVRRVKKIEKK